MPRLGLGSSLTGVVPPSAAAVSTYSLALDGTDQIVDLRDNSTQPTGFPLGDTDRTVAVWIKPDDITSANNTMFQYGHVHAGKAFLFQQSSQAGKFGVNNGGEALTSSDVLTVDEWQHIAATFISSEGDYGTYRLYRNGVEVAEKAFTVRATNTVVLDGNYYATIGGRHYAGSIGYTFGGNMDDVGLWEVGLDVDALIAIYNSGVPTDLTVDDGDYDNSGDLVGYWKFEEGTGTSAADSSGTGNTGTLTNTPTWSTDVPE